MNSKRKAIQILAALAMVAGLPACESGGALSGIREHDGGRSAEFPAPTGTSASPA